MQAHNGYGQQEASQVERDDLTSRRFSNALVTTFILLYAVFGSTQANAQVTAVVEMWGVAGEEQHVRDIALNGSDVYLSGQKGTINGVFAGRGYVCKHATGGCSSVATETETFLAAGRGGGSEHYSDAWEMASDGTYLFIASKSKDGSSPIGCPPSGGRTDSWIQSRPLTDLTSIGYCDHPALPKNDEGLAVKIIDDHIYWGGTMGSPTHRNQYAVLHKQSSKLLRGIEATFEFTGTALSELFDITSGGGLIFATGRTETDFVATVCSPLTNAVCSGGQDLETDAWVAAFNANLELVWLWQDASIGKSAGQGIEYVDNGSGNPGLVLVGHYAETDQCSGYLGSPVPSGEPYTQGFVTWLPLTGGIFDATTATATQVLYGGNCVGDTFSDVAVNGTNIYAVGTILGPPSQCTGQQAKPDSNHCKPNGMEDAALVEYTLNFTGSTPSINLVANRTYQGTSGDSTDSFITVEHDGSNKLYMGGYTQSSAIDSNLRTGVQDSLLVTLTY